MIELVVATFALTFLRVGTFIHFVPLLGGPNTPRLPKLGLTGAITIVLFSVDSSTTLANVAAMMAGSMPWLRLSLALCREALLGGLLGSAFAVFLAPARIAGEFIAQESGLTFANVVTATGEGAANPLSTVFEMLAALVYFSLDLHHVFLLMLQETFRLYPLGQPYALPNIDYVTAVSAAGEGGLALAAPVALCLFLTTVVLALMTRAAPQLNLYSVGFPLRVLVSLGAMTILIPSFISGLVGLFSFFLELLQMRG